MKFLASGGEYGNINIYSLILRDPNEYERNFRSSSLTRSVQESPSEDKDLGQNLLAENFELKRQLSELKEKAQKLENVEKENLYALKKLHDLSKLLSPDAIPPDTLSLKSQADLTFDQALNLLSLHPMVIFYPLLFFL